MMKVNVTIMIVKDFIDILLTNNIFLPQACEIILRDETKMLLDLHARCEERGKFETSDQKTQTKTWQ